VVAAGGGHSSDDHLVQGADHARDGLRGDATVALHCGMLVSRLELSDQSWLDGGMYMMALGSSHGVNGTARHMRQFQSHTTVAQTHMRAGKGGLLCGGGNGRRGCVPLRDQLTCAS